MSAKTENNGAEETPKTPLELVREQQSMNQKSRAALDNRPDHNVDVPGHSEPSDKRKHPQRQLYDGGGH
jgi:hypothetical protein